METALFIYENNLCNDFIYSRERNEIFIFKEERCLWFYMDHQTFRRILLERIEKATKEHYVSITLVEILGKLRNPRFQLNVFGKLLYLFPDLYLNDIRYLLPLPGNKVLDLRSNTLMNRFKLHYFSSECNVDWNPQANSGFILKYLNKIVSGDQELLFRLQIVLGSLLTSETNLCKGLYLSGDVLHIIILLKSILGSLGVEMDQCKDRSQLFSFIKNYYRLAFCKNVHCEDLPIKQIVYTKCPVNIVPEGFEAIILSSSQEFEDNFIFSSKEILESENKSAFFNWCIEGAKRYLLL